MVLHCKSYLLAPLTMAFAAVALRLRKDEPVEKQQCSFLAHVPGSEHDEAWITTSLNNTLFRQEDVFVVAGEGALRYLVFRQADGSCYEQAEQTCRASADMQQSLSADGCTPCDVGEAVPPLSYIKSMIAGAFQPLLSAGVVQPDRVLAVGLGSGALASWLLKHSPATVDVAELSGAVVAAADCFNLGAQPQLNLVQTDGRAFLEEQPQGVYDAIFVDAFDASDTIPCALSTYEFFQLVNSRLKPSGGVFSFNVVEKPRLEDLLPSLMRVFPHVSTGLAPGLTNKIVIASQLELDGQEPPGGTETVMRWFQEASFQKVSSEGFRNGVQSRQDSMCS